MSNINYRNERLEAHKKKQQDKYNKTIGKIPKRLKAKSGMINNITQRYELSKAAANEYNNLVRNSTAIKLRFALIKAIDEAGHTSRDNIIKMFFYAKDISAYAHFINTGIDNADTSQVKNLGEEIVRNMINDSFARTVNQAKKIVESVEEVQPSEVSDELQKILDSLDELDSRFN